MLTRLGPLACSALLLLSACGGGGSGGSEGGAEAAQPKPAQTAKSPTPSAGSSVSARPSAVRSCLAQADLRPQKSGLWLMSSKWSLEAIAVRAEQAGRVLVYVFPPAGDAASSKEQIASQHNAAASVEVLGNVILVYEFKPSASERSVIEGCVTKG